MGSASDYIAVLCVMLISWATVSATLASDNKSYISGPYEMEEVTVTSTPFERPEVRVPIAIGSVSKDQIQLGRQQLSLQESLATIPGLFFQDKHNFAQDLRISIRGFGARANFGIRGIKIITDGIPSTLPDGQGNVDDVDLGSTQRIEVIRGPSSSLYGSSAGGVINIFTEDGPEIPFVEERLTFGSYGFQKYQLKGGGQYKQLNYLVNLSHLSYSGYRDHSRTESTLLNTKFRYDIDLTSNLTAVINLVDSPEAKDPGALTESEAKGNRRQAAPRNLLFDAGEEVKQQKIGLVYHKMFGAKHRITLRNFYVWREFDNFLPFEVNSNGQGGSVDLHRLFFGGSANYTYEEQIFGRPNSLKVGFEIEAQRDERKRYANDSGVRAALTTNQDEDVTSYSLFLQDEFGILENLSLTFGGRYNILNYDIDDKIGSSSDNRTFDEPSAMVGLLWTVVPAVNIYGNISTSFETPTTTEFANPFGPTGFNPLLKAQTAINYEIGVKGLLPAHMRYELALFRIKVEDELVPFELSGSGQTFSESVGKSTRRGLEMSLVFQPTDGLTMTQTYTYSDFTFDRFTDRNDNVFDGNELPGVPEHLFHSKISYFHSNGLHADLDVLHVGSFFADNANVVETDSYTVANLRIAYKGELGNWKFSPFFGINNMFNEHYNDNIRLNASFSRFFEPAPERNFYGGIGISYNLDF